MGYKSHAQRKAVHASKAEKKGASMKKYGASKKKFPEIKEKNEGKFTKWVEKNMPGTDTCKAASKIMRSRTKKYSPSVVKMANYANNFGCKTKKEGASFNPKLKKAVADGKIKNKKFADAIMGSSMSDTTYTKTNSKGKTKEISEKKYKKKARKGGSRLNETESMPTKTGTRITRSQSTYQRNKKGNIKGSVSKTTTTFKKRR